MNVTHLWKEKESGGKGQVVSSMVMEEPGGARSRLWYRVSEKFARLLAPGKNPFVFGTLSRTARRTDRMEVHGDVFSSLLLVIATAVHFLLLIMGRSVLPQPVLFILFFLSIVLLPGFVLSGIIFPGPSRLLRFMISFLTGISLVYMVLIIFSIFKFDIIYIGVVIPLLTIAMAIISGSVVFPATSIFVERKEWNERYPKMTIILLVLLLLFVSILILSYGDPLAIISDSPDHIAYIRAVSKSHEPFPSTFLYADGGMLTRDVRRGLAHAMWGMLNCLTGYEGVEAVWPLISMIGSIFNILALFCAGVLMFRNPAIGLLSAFVLVFMDYEGLAGLKLIYTAYGFPFGNIFLILFLIFVILFLQDGRRSHLILALLSSFAATATHIGHFILGIFIIVVLSIGEWIEQNRSGKVKLMNKLLPILAGSVVLVNIPYVLMRYLRDYAPNNTIHTHLQGMLMFTDRIYIMNPFIVYGLKMPLAILVFISLFLLWKGSSKERALRLMIWGTIGIYATIFNPLIVPIAAKNISYMLLRFVSAVPPMILAACLIHEIWMKLSGKPALISRAGANVGLIAVIILFGSVLVKIPNGFAYKKGNVPVETTCGNMSDLYKVLNSQVPMGSVVASDPMTSYTIPAFTDQYVVCTLDQHSVPNDSTALQRILDCRSIFYPGTPIKEVVLLLERYNAGYIVVNGRIPGYLQSMYWMPSVSRSESAMKRFSRLPDIFELVYSDRSLALYKFRRENFNETVCHIDPEQRTAEPAVSVEETSCFAGSGIEGILIRDVDLGAITARRGDRLPVRVEWVSTSKCATDSYRAFIRFDAGFDKNFLYNRAYGKVYRKILETVEGKRYRFRGEWQPLGGLYPPDMWPILAVVSDSTEILIPPDISPGEYRVFLRLNRIPQYPNYLIRDLLTDEDVYQGEKVGLITIE